MPDWVENEPDIYPGDDFYLHAFYELSSCRQTGDSPGPIPWTCVTQYADRRELDWDISLYFERVIRTMDNAYLKWYSKMAKARQPKAPKQKVR